MALFKELARLRTWNNTPLIVGNSVNPLLSLRRLTAETNVPFVATSPRWHSL
jgi:hypothetical protein